MLCGIIWTFPIWKQLKIILKQNHNSVTVRPQAGIIVGVYFWQVNTQYMWSTLGIINDDDN